MRPSLKPFALRARAGHQPDLTEVPSACVGMLTTAEGPACTEATPVYTPASAPAESTAPGAEQMDHRLILTSFTVKRHAPPAPDGCQDSIV